MRGMRCVQMEPVWGGRSDTAGALRGICGLALVQCRSLPEMKLLRCLADLLYDPDQTARGDAVRAIAQVGSSAASLLLRSRALGGGDEVEILGGCYGAILEIEGNAALTWVSRFLKKEDEAAGEAALAIAATHSAEAFALLKQHWEKTRDDWFRSVLLSAIALTRQSVALEFLLGLVEADSLQSEPAAEAILRASPGPEMITRLTALARGRPRLQKLIGEHTEERERS